MTIFIYFVISSYHYQFHIDVWWWMKKKKEEETEMMRIKIMLGILDHFNLRLSFLSFFPNDFRVKIDRLLYLIQKLPSELEFSSWCEND